MKLLEKIKNKKINSLLNATFFYLIGNAIGQGVILLSSIVFTRVMTKNDYGMYSTYYSLVAILTTLVGVNLFQGLCNAYIDYKQDIYRFRSSVLFLSTISFVVVSVLTIIINQMFNFGYTLFLVVAALIHAYGFFVINYFNNSANMENRYKAKTVFMILPYVLQVAVSLLLIYFMPEQKLEARVIGSAGGVLGCAIVAYALLLKKGKITINKEYWSYALKISVPSVLASISYMIMQQCDNIMITKFHGAEETAVYALVYNVGYILYAVLQATNGVLCAWLYKALDTGETRKLKKVQKWYLVIFLILSFGLFMIAPEIVKILSPKEYWDFSYIPPFVISSCFMMMYSFYTTVGMFYKKSTQVSLCVFVAAIMNIVLNYILIPKFGGVAAAYTSLASYLVVFFLTRVVSQKLNRDLFSMKCFMMFLGVLIVGAVIFTVVKDTILLRYGVFLVLLFILMGYMFVHRKEIIEIVEVK